MNTIPEGFRTIPGIPYFAVSEEGEVFRINDSTYATISKQPVGYCNVGSNLGGVSKTYYVHRLVALAFIPIPEEVSSATLNPEVNHKDGDKSNNRVSNLEWVTSKGNSEHAYKNGLVKLRKVKAKNLLTNEEIIYSCYHEVSRHFNISIKRLPRHLESEFAGMYTKDYWAFMYDDVGEWPELDPDCIIPDRWDRSYGIWIAEKDGQQYLSATLQKMCEVAGLKYNSIQPEVRGDGKTYTVMGWNIWYSNLPTKQMLDEVEYKPEHKFRPTRKVKMTHLKSKAVAYYDSLRAAGRQLDIVGTTLLYAMTKKNGVHDGMHFEYID